VVSWWHMHYENSRFCNLLRTLTIDDRGLQMTTVALGYSSFRFRSLIVEMFNSIDISITRLTCKVGPWPWFSPYPTRHIGPHSKSIRVCQGLPPLLPPRWTLFRRSLLTTPLQFALGRPGPLLYPGTWQHSACCAMRLWSILVRRFS